MAKNKQPSKAVVMGKPYSMILKDKSLLIDTYIRLMTNRCARIFEWKNLPETIPQRELEMIVQNCRFAIFKKVENEFYVFFGGLGGVPDVYYHPSDAIISNPYLKYFDVCKIDDECVIIWNDTTRLGLIPLHMKYAEQLAETDISLRFANINARIPALVSADNDNTKESAKKFFEDIESGESFNVIATSMFFEGLKTNEYSTKSGSSTIKDLIEEQQYIKASWYNDLGINANYNMKREAINESEASLNEDALLPLRDDMLHERQIACDKINKMFGLNISVELSSTWKKIRTDIKLQEEIKESEIDENEQKDVKNLGEEKTEEIEDGKNQTD